MAKELESSREGKKERIRTLILGPCVSAMDSTTRSNICFVDIVARYCEAGLINELFKIRPIPYHIKG